MNKNPDLELDQLLGYQVNRAAIVFRKQLTIRFKKSGCNLTPEDFSIISRLWEENGISQSLLVEKTLKDKTRVTKLLGSLIKKNYIYKVTDKSDRRNKTIFLTEEGDRLKKIIIPIVLELNEQATDGIDSDDVLLLQTLLGKLIGNLGN